MAIKTIPAPAGQSLIDYEALFQSLADAYIVFGVDDPVFTILEENEAHARIALTNRVKSIGKPVFKVFPDTSDEYITSGVSQLLESIRRVIRTGQIDTMPYLKYDIPNKDGSMTQRYWNVSHHPVFNENHKIIAVYQATQDITTQRTAERQLAVTKYQLDQTLANGSVGTWTWNIKDKKIYAGPNLAHMFGLNERSAEKGLPLQTFLRGIHPDDRSMAREKVALAIKQQSSFEWECRTIDHSKRIHWIIARGRVEIGDDGQPDRFPGVVIDITERKEAEQDLADSENRLRFMADTMPQLVWVAGANGRGEYYNQKWYQYTGAEGGDDQRSFLHKDDKARTLRAWRKSLKTGESYEIEYRLYHAPSASYRWVIGRALPFHDSKGKVIKWYGTCTDIDKQKRDAQLQEFLAAASKELSASLDYRKTLQSVSKMCVPEIADWCTVDLYNETSGYEQIAVAHADPAKISLAVEHRRRNPPVSDGSSGVSRVVKTGISEFYPFIDSAMLEQYIDDDDQLTFMKSLNLHSMIMAPLKIENLTVGAISFVSTDSGRYYTEDDLRMAEELAVRISLAMTNAKLYNDSLHEIKQRKKFEKALKLEQQKLESRVKERTVQLQRTNDELREEISKRHTAEVGLKENAKNLARSNQELQDFAYVASHDLQEPLRKIQAFGDLLETEYGVLLGDGQAYLNRMRNAASRMSTLIEDLLAFSRVTTKAQPGIRVDLNEIAKEVISDLETRIEATGGKVELSPLPTVMADPTHMRQLLQNLIGNALKFHRDGVAPIVKIYAEAPTNSRTNHLIYIADNGIGFDKKYLDRIFAVFQRLHGREAYEGTGIGLAVCRKIVERYGGTITAESQKNHGATFIISLPVVKRS